VLPATVHEPGTVAVPIDSPKASRSIYAIWSRSRDLTRAAADFRDYILSTAPALLASSTNE
jgi:DNA-binding transcriptional LysR family regulator